MNNTRLFLYNATLSGQPNNEYEVELDSAVQFSITRQFEDLSNPSIIINDWSKTIAIPFTKHNNEVFGFIFKADRKVDVSTNGGKIGTFGFNPSKKVTFRLFYNDSLLMSGYMKVLSVEQTSSVSGRYNVTLNGELGRIFQEMKKITFDKEANDDDYYKIKGEDYVNTGINKELVNNSWNYGVPTRESLEKIYNINKTPNPNYNINDLIGFAPNNAFSENFDYESFKNSSDVIEKLSDILESRWTGLGFSSPVTADSLLKNGLTPRGKGDYRSYNQLPFIYFNKLFKLFELYVNNNTGYSFELDNSWFNKNNPYWFNTVYMLKQLNTIKVTPFENNYTSFILGYPASESENDVYTFPLYPTAIDNGGTLAYPLKLQLRVNESGGGLNEQIPIYKRGEYNPAKPSTAILRYYFDLSEYKIVNVDLNNFGLKFWINTILPDTVIGQRLVLSNNNALLITLNILKSTDNIYSSVDPPTPIESYKYVIARSNCTLDLSALISAGYTKIEIDYLNLTPVEGWQNYYVVTLPLIINENIKIPNTVYGTGIKFSNTCCWYAQGVQTMYCVYNTGSGWNTVSQILPFEEHEGQSATGSSLDIIHESNFILKELETIQSGSGFTLNDLWNNDYNIFEEILKYCKQYRIYIIADDVNKKIKFIPYYKFFQQGSIEDWTEKVDYNQQWKLEPLIVDTKNILFNYEDSDVDVAKDYKEKFGFNFGEKNLITEYSFNTETTNLFDKINLPITSTDSVLSWRTIYDSDTPSIVYSIGDEQFINNKDKDSKEVDCFGQMYLHNGKKKFDNEGESGLRGVQITDDSQTEIDTNKKCYNDDTDTKINTNYYPYLDTIYDDKICLFNKPNKVYTVGTDYKYAKSIYDSFWSRYLSDLYSVQNKKVTCYIRLTPEDYMNFEFNKLVVVENTLYLVNKIFDYNVNSNNSTKVELISIKDVNNYYYYDYYYWVVNPTVIDYETIQYTSHTFTFNVSGMNINKNTLTTTIKSRPSSWTVNPTITFTDDDNGLLNVYVQSPMVVVSGEYTIVVTLSDSSGKEVDVTMNIKVTGQ